MEVRAVAWGLLRGITFRFAVARDDRGPWVPRTEVDRRVSRRCPLATEPPPDCALRRFVPARLNLGRRPLSPLVEAGFCQDEGDAETGRGLEVASGLRYRNRGLFMEVTGRSLVSHEDDRYREWGVGGSVRLDPGPDYLGLAVQVNSAHGAAASTVQRLWSDTGAVNYFRGAVRGRHEAEIGYGFETLRGGAMVIPFSGFVYSPSGNEEFSPRQPDEGRLALDAEPAGRPEQLRIPRAFVRAGPARAPVSGTAGAAGAGGGRAIAGTPHTLGVVAIQVPGNAPFAALSGRDADLARAPSPGESGQSACLTPVVKPT